MDVIDDFSWQNTQKLFEDIVECGLKAGRGGTSLRNARVASRQTTVLEDGVQACLKFRLSSFIETGLRKVDSSDGILDSILDGV